MIRSFVANLVTKPGASPVFNSPRDIGAHYRDVTFKCKDGVKLSGWLLDGSTDKVIIFSHYGIQSCRSGYTTQGKSRFGRYHKDINYLDMAQHLINAGYSVLMYDLRNHGNSQMGTNPWITGGTEEYKDVLAAVQFISEHKKYHNASIGLLSYCMGTNATTNAFGKGLKNNPKIKAYISVQPITNAIFLKGLGLPNFLIKSTNRFHIKRGGTDLYASCMPNVKNINVPTMVVQSKGDAWADFDWVQEYYNNIKTEKEMYWLEPTTNRLDGYDWFGHTPKRMLDFFNKYTNPCETVLD